MHLETLVWADSTQREVGEERLFCSYCLFALTLFRWTVRLQLIACILARLLNTISVLITPRGQFHGEATGALAVVAPGRQGAGGLSPSLACGAQREKRSNQLPSFFTFLPPL